MRHLYQQYILQCMLFEELPFSVFISKYIKYKNANFEALVTVVSSQFVAFIIEMAKMPNTAS